MKTSVKVVLTVIGIHFTVSVTWAQVLDAFGDTLGHGAFRKEMGQTANTDGEVVTGITHYSEGSPIKLWLHDDASVTYSMATDDTIYSVLQQFTGEDYNAGSDLVEGIQTQDHANYYKPWGRVEEVPAYRSIRRNNVFTDIDALYYFGRSGPKVALILQPGSSPTSIQIQYTGQDSLGVDLAGMLVLYHGEYQIRLNEAYAYQVDESYDIIAIGWTPYYAVDGNSGIVSFEFDTYDTNLPLIFQIGPPPLGGGGGGGDAWRTLLGSQTDVGAGESWGNAAVAAPDGDILIAGNTIDDAFPANTGAVPHAGVWDMYYGRFEYAPGNPTTDAERIYTTYYGGSGSEKPQIAHYSSDDVLYVGGWTNSSNVPIKPLTNPLDGSYWQNMLKGTTDGVLLKADPVNGLLLRSTYFGGQGQEMFTAVTEDVFGNLYFGGATSTATGTYSGTCTAVTNGLPLCDPGGTAYQQTTNGGGTDVFLLKLDEDFTMLNSTYYGGSTDDLLYDMAYYQDPAGFNDRIICVGRTDGSLPQGDPGDFWLPGISDSTAFIATFHPNGAIEWMTNLHGVYRLEAAAVQPETDQLVVMGHTKDTDDGAVPTSNTCSAVTGTISICDPGNGAYQDNSVDRVDEYYAEFNVLSGEMLWSTIHGGSIRENADYTATLEYDTRQYHPFLIRRFSDLAVDEEGTIYALGIGMQAGEYAIMLGLDHPTLGAYGYYNQPWHPDMGFLQSEILLKCFDGRRQRVWSSTFGSRFTHLYVNDPEEQQMDKAWRPGGCDWGHSLVLLPGEALYWAGSSGGIAFDDACPYPSVSWCEPTVLFGSAADLSHGFIARMNLEGLSIGVTDLPSPMEEGLTCYPNPADEIVRLAFAGQPIVNESIEIFDAQGKLVLRARTDQYGSIRLTYAGTGLYNAVWRTVDGEFFSGVRFIKR